MHYYLKYVIFTLLWTLIFSLILSVLICIKTSNLGFKEIKNIISDYLSSLKKDRNRLATFLFVFFSVMILSLTVIGRESDYAPLSDVWGGWRIFKTQYTGLDYQVIGNTVMFLPFGLLWVLTFEREEKSAKALLGALLSSLIFSAFIELNQLIFSKGTFQFSDIVYNTLGGLLGGGIAVLINLIHNKRNG